jgi:hypothetical protein
MKQKQTIIALVSLGLLVILFTGCTERPGKIELSATEYDFGTIPNNAAVTQVFEVRNVGAGKLEIAGVSTSCGCTTAKIDRRQLAPGETAELAVMYDPLAHNGATGQFMRMIYIRSDDPDVPEITLTVRVTVTEL